MIKNIIECGMKKLNLNAICGKDNIIKSIENIFSKCIRIGRKEMWINYMKAGDFNPPHSHGADLSFVAFPDVPKEIIEECGEFKGTMRGPGGVSWLYGDGNRQCITVVHRLPETRDLFIFPAFLKHWVFPFKSDVERISVSGNVLFDQDSRMNYLGPIKKGDINE